MTKLPIIWAVPPHTTLTRNTTHTALTWNLGEAALRCTPESGPWKFQCIQSYLLELCNMINFRWFFRTISSIYFGWTFGLWMGMKIIYVVTDKINPVLMPLYGRWRLWYVVLDNRLTYAFYCSDCFTTEKSIKILTSLYWIFGTKSQWNLSYYMQRKQPEIVVFQLPGPWVCTSWEARKAGAGATQVRGINDKKCSWCIRYI